MYPNLMLAALALRIARLQQAGDSAAAKAEHKQALSNYGKDIRPELDRLVTDFIVVSMMEEQS